MEGFPTRLGCAASRVLSRLEERYKLAAGRAPPFRQWPTVGLCADCALRTYRLVTVQ